MRINVVTSFSPAGYATYGKLMLKSFDWGWPKDIGLYMFIEGPIHPEDAPIFAESRRVKCINLNDDKDRAAFMATHKDRPRDHPHAYLEWPVKFCHKVFAMTSAPRDCDWLIWLDADIETTRPITQEFLASILPDDATAVYLGRKWWTHTETGFLAFNLNEDGGKFLDEFRSVYTSNEIMGFESKTDCNAFDYVREEWELCGYKLHNLGADHKGPEIDVMSASVLGPYLWHNKGDYRKIKAYGKVA